jgi:hypothetical protein
MAKWAPVNVWATPKRKLDRSSSDCIRVGCEFPPPSRRPSLSLSRWDPGLWLGLEMIGARAVPLCGVAIGAMRNFFTALLVTGTHSRSSSSAPCYTALGESFW